MLLYTALGNSESRYGCRSISWQIRHTVRISGSHAGQCRLITGTALNQIRWNRPFGSPPAIGSAFRVLQSNFSFRRRTQVAATSDLSTYDAQAQEARDQIGAGANIQSNVTLDGTIVAGDAVRWDPGIQGYAKAIADGTSNQNVIGIADPTQSTVVTNGLTDDIFSGLTPGARYYLSSSQAGKLTTVPPANRVSVIVARDATSGFVIIQNDSVAVPRESKMLFYMDAAPAGWSLVDGKNDRAIIIDNNAGASDGGSWQISGISVNSHQLTEAELGAHSHLGSSLTVTEGGDHTHAAGALTTVRGGDISSRSIGTAIQDGGNHTHNIGTIRAQPNSINIQTVQVSRQNPGRADAIPLQIKTDVPLAGAPRIALGGGGAIGGAPPQPVAQVGSSVGSIVAGATGGRGNQDFDFAGLSGIEGLWSDGNIMWVATRSSAGIVAYNFTTRDRSPTDDIALPGDGLWSDGTHMYISYYGHLYVWHIASGVRDQTKEFSIAPADGFSIWSDGTTIWAGDRSSQAPTLYAFVLSTGARDPSKDISITEGNNPEGLWSDGTTIWVVDLVLRKVTAYNLSTGIRDPDKDVDALRSAGNNSPYGLFADGTTMWVSDSVSRKAFSYVMASSARSIGGSPTRDFTDLFSGGQRSSYGLWSNGITIWSLDPDTETARAYDLLSRARDNTKDFDFSTSLGSGKNLQGIWSNGATVWVASEADVRLYAVNFSDGSADSSKNINLSDTNRTPRGVWSDGTIIWVVDESSSRLFAYNLSTRERSADDDILLAVDGTNLIPKGLWSDGVTMWVADYDLRTVFAYNVQTKARDPFKDFSLTLAANDHVYGLWANNTFMWASVITTPGYGVGAAVDLTDSAVTSTFRSRILAYPMASRYSSASGAVAVDPTENTAWITITNQEYRHEHSMSGEVDAGGAHTHDGSVQIPAVEGHVHSVTGASASGGGHGHNIAGSTGESGEGQGHDHGLTIGNSWRPLYAKVILCNKEF